MRVGTATDTDVEAVGTMREGKLDQKHLLFGEDGSPNNLDLNTGLTGGGGWRTPRHRHNFDQIRYVLKGRLPYSETDFLEEGWLGYFPESVHYGPQERAEGLQTVDGSQAIFERAMGHKLEFATPRYTDVIAMNPEAYDWLPQGDPGVQEKWVGTFTERNLRLGFLRLDAGAVYQAGQFPSIEILFQIKGQVSTGGRKYGPETGYEFLANEGPIPVEAIEPTEFLRAVLHQF